MAMTDRVNTRIDARLKQAAERIFEKLGLSAGEAIRLFYAQVDLHQGLPFDVKVPNEETLAAMRELEERLEAAYREDASESERLHEEWEPVDAEVTE